MLRAASLAHGDNCDMHTPVLNSLAGFECASSVSGLVDLFGDLAEKAKEKVIFSNTDADPQLRVCTALAVRLYLLLISLFFFVWGFAAYDCISLTPLYGFNFKTLNGF